MFDLMSTTLLAATLLAASSALATAYVVCLVVGGGLLAISTILGGDADGGLDAAADVGVDLDADLDLDLDSGAADAAHAAADGVGLSLATWFSVQFVVYFVAVFGLIGTVLTYLSDYGQATIFALAVGGGLVMGQGVHQLMRLLRRTSGNTATSTADYINKTARVKMAIAPPNRGEVAIPIRGGTRFVPAVARRNDDRFEPGDQVVVVAFRNGTAEVMSRKEYEFRTDSEAD